MDVTCTGDFGEEYMVVQSFSPIEFGMELTGIYQVIPLIQLNGYPVYKHNHLAYFAFFNQDKMVITYEHIYDVATKGQTLEMDTTYQILVWNGDKAEFLPEPSLRILFSKTVPIDPNSTNIEIPCKVEISSEGRIGEVFPEQMGIYKVIDNLLVNNRPVLKHISRNYYMRVNENGYWIVTSVSFTFKNYFPPACSTDGTNKLKCQKNFTQQVHN